MEIKIYTTPSCVQCEMTKKQFDLHGLKYTSIDLALNPEAMADIAQYGYASAPVVVAGDISWSGFKYARITDLVHLVRTEERSKAVT